MSLYRSTAALRRALEDRLLMIARKSGADIQRLRRQAAFDRLLARLFYTTPTPWILKGGYAMELRLHTARSTRDIDLALRPVDNEMREFDIEEVRTLLQKDASLDLDDGFDFTIGELTRDLEAAPYGGGRFPVDAKMAGRRFALFNLDVSAGDVLREPFETLEGEDWLGFAGIAPSKLVAISREEQFAEKLHAYTLPREGAMNSRVKDLVDMVLLIDAGIDAPRLATMVKMTFKRRGTHKVPACFPLPPSEWGLKFKELALECGVNGDLIAQHHRINHFLAAILRWEV